MAQGYDVLLLTDTYTGQTTDLKESPYTFLADGAEDADRRFSLSFRRKEDGEPTVQVYLHERTLYVKGLQGGERIFLYDTSGHCLLDAPKPGFAIHGESRWHWRVYCRCGITSLSPLVQGGIVVNRD